jgi:hypothetical protein
MTLNEATFQRAWGRAPSAVSVERLRRLQEALGVGENDGLVTIAMVLEFYDQLYRQYPDQCADAARQAIHDGLSSAAGLCVTAIQQTIESGLAAVEPRCANAARRAVREELATMRPSTFPTVALPQGRAPELSLQRTLGLWLGYSLVLAALCSWGGDTLRTWTALSAATGGFAALSIIVRLLGRERASRRP